MPAVSAEWNVDIVAEKAAERHMPPPPKFRNRFGNIRIIEVFREAEAENPSKADGHIAVARKVEVQLDDIHKTAEPSGKCRQRRRICLHILFGKHTGCIRKNHLFGKTADKTLHPGIGRRNGMRACADLLLHIGIAHDRSGDKLKIHGKVQQIAGKARLRLAVAAIHIDDIG